jgi:Methylamine utilisation protein MauE
MSITLLRLVADLTPLVLAGLLAWTGGLKLSSRHTARQAAGSALARLLPPPRAAAVLRAAGAAELAAAAALLVVPLSPVTVAAAVALGACFAAYLGYAKARAPDSSCGCASARHTPVTWRSFARAGLVMAGGAACAAAAQPWWTAAARRPAAAAVIVSAVAVVFAAVSGELDDYWLLPLRRARVRLLPHPLAGAAGQVPVAATVELLERSLAWQVMMPVIRSGLADHWDSAGWRILRYSGVHNGPGGPRPVSVLFAVDASATAGGATEPAIRVSMVDEERQETIDVPAPQATRHRSLPLTATGLASA